MDLLILKLVLTPVLIAAATLASRRWGSLVGGLVAGLPLTSGPVSVFLALEQGNSFAAQAALGTLLGLVAVAAFCVAYCRSSINARWPVSTTFGLLTFLAATTILRHVSPSMILVCAAVLVSLAVALVALPKPAATASFKPSPWDLPLRMLAATSTVVVLTAVAGTLGPQLSGLLSPFPVFATVLAAFAHSSQGSGAAIQLLRGVVLGSFGFAAFFAVVTIALPNLGVTVTYVLAALAAISINALWLMATRHN